MTTMLPRRTAQYLSGASPDPVISLRGAELSFGRRTLWEDLDLDIMPGEFFAVLGPNGSGKTSLLRVLLGLQELDAGSATLQGRPITRGRRTVGYIPQQKSFAPETPLRARDLVGLGVDGHRWGLRLRSSAYTARVDELLHAVGAESYADAPVGLLSGGEQQRLRAAQALATDPSVLLCDEPLLSLDLHHQRAISSLIDRQCHAQGSAVVFVTHEINPVIDYVDRVLYLADGRFRVGTPAEVMTSEVLTELYDSPVEVLHSNGRIVVVGGADGTAHHEGER